MSEDDETPTPATEHTTPKNQPTTSKSKTKSQSADRGLKRRRPSTPDFEKKIVDILEAQANDEDEFYHFGISVAKTLKSLPPQKAALAKVEISTLLYNIQFGEK